MTKGQIYGERIGEGEDIALVYHMPTCNPPKQYYLLLGVTVELIETRGCVMKGVIYCRTSDDPTEKKLKIERRGIPEQLTSCERMAESMHVPIVERYLEYDRSGKLYPTGFEAQAELDLVVKAYLERVRKPKAELFRQELGRMFKNLDGITHVFVDDDCRLMRPLMHSQLNSILQIFALNKIKFVVSSSGAIIDFSVYEQALISYFMLSSKTQSSEEYLARARRSIKSTIDSGGSHGSEMIFGYRKIITKLQDGTETRHMEINEPEAEIVRAIHRMYLMGVSKTKICDDKELNQKKALLPNLGKKKRNGALTSHLVQTILSNPKYAGYQENSSGELIKAILFQGKELLTLSDHLKIKEMNVKGVQFGSCTKKRVYPLSTLLICEKCGAHLVAKKQTKEKGKFKIYYICQNKLKHRCDSENVLVTVNKPSTPFDNEIKGVGIEECLKPLCYLALGKRNIKKEENAIAKLELELSQIEKYELVLGDKLKKDTIDSAEFDRLFLKDKKRKVEIKAELLKLKSQVESVNVDKGERAVLEVALTSGKFNDEWYKAIINQVIARVVCGEDSVKVELKEGGSFKIDKLVVRGSKRFPVPDTTRIKGSGKYHIIYFYSKSTKWKNLYNSDTLEIDRTV